MMDVVRKDRIQFFTCGTQVQEHLDWGGEGAAFIHKFSQEWIS